MLPIYRDPICIHKFSRGLNFSATHIFEGQIYSHRSALDYRNIIELSLRLLLKGKGFLIGISLFPDNSHEVWLLEAFLSLFSHRRDHTISVEPMFWDKMNIHPSLAFWLVSNWGWANLFFQVHNCSENGWFFDNFWLSLQILKWRMCPSREGKHHWSDLPYCKTYNWSTCELDCG